MSTFIDIHALQTLPPSNINRDDTGAPKSATFGGVPRQRVSSQAWKSAIRQDFASNLDDSQLGLRTKRAAEKVVAKIQEISEGYDYNQALSEVEAAFKTVKISLAEPKKQKEEDAAKTLETGYLLLLSTQQINRLAHAIIDADGEKLKKTDVANILDTQHSVDIALFGRMLADAPDFNVDASCQVAHAIGVHGSEPEFDYYTAVDDVVRDAEEESGAGMIGTVEMMSSTLYRYANINLDGLAKNLDDKQAAVVATLQFIKSFITAMPTGKQNSFANRTLPEAVIVTLRDDRPVSYVNAFETPVKESADQGRRVVAAQALAKEATELAETYGLEPLKSYVLAVGDLKDALENMGESVTLKTLSEKLELDLTEVLAN